MYKRLGGCCLRCGKCCRSFNLLGSAYESFRLAQRKYGLKLIRNKDGTYKCSMLKDNLCSIHKNKPKVCKEAPRVPFPWRCGYKFREIKKRGIKRDTEKAIHLLEEINASGKIDFQTQEALDYGRRYLDGDH